MPSDNRKGFHFKNLKQAQKIINLEHERDELLEWRKIAIKGRLKRTSTMDQNYEIEPFVLKEEPPNKKPKIFKSLEIPTFDQNVCEVNDETSFEKKLTQLKLLVASKHIVKPNDFISGLEEIFGKQRFMKLKNLMKKNILQNETLADKSVVIDLTLSKNSNSMETVSVTKSQLTDIESEGSKDNKTTQETPQLLLSSNGSAYNNISPDCRIVRAIVNQSDEDVFNPDYAGKQCCAMALASVVRSKLQMPREWTTDTVNENLQEGDAIYEIIRTKSQGKGIQIPDSGYLFIRNFDLFKSDLKMYNNTFKLKYRNDPAIVGNLEDARNEDSAGVTLFEGLQRLFVKYSTGILIANSKSFALIKSNGRFYFCDSHACDEFGAPTDDEGVACVIECDTLEALNRTCKQTAGSENFQYTIDSIQVALISDYDSDDDSDHDSDDE